MKKFAQFLTALFVLSVFLLLAKSTKAAVRCETVYGGGETCVKTGELQIDKEIWNSQEGKFVDNLGITSYKFTTGEEIVFKLKIKNIGDEKFDKVQVRDYLPGYLEAISGDLSFEIDDLDPGETVEREIKTKVTSLPNDKTTLCEVNTAEAWSGDERDRDTAQVCFEKKVLGAAIQPATGPQDWLLYLTLFTLAGISGLSLRKFNQRIEEEGR